MAPTVQSGDSLKFFQDIITGISVRLNRSSVISEQLEYDLLSMGTFIIMEEHLICLYISDQPQISFYSSLLFVVNNRDCGFIGLKIVL